MKGDDTPRRSIRRMAGTAIQATLLGASLVLFLVLGLGPHTGRMQVFTVLTASMDPAIPAGSAVVTTPVSPAELKVGDVITYRIPVQDRRVVTHRIVSLDLDPAGGRPTIRTQGDANEDVDQWTTRFGDGPVWKVRYHLAGAGRGLRAVQTPAARKLVLWSGPVLLALLCLLQAKAKPASTRRIPDVIVVRPRRRTLTRSSQ